MSESKTYGQVAYEAYAAALGWKSGVTGQELPQWDDERVTPQIKDGWAASAGAVRNLHVSSKPECSTPEAVEEAA